jgi:UDP-N-acetyl-D-glucosamine dehydrogenase
VNTLFIELAGQINHAMPGWVMAKVSDALNARGKAVKGSRVLVLGLAYKKNVDDLRESPAVELVHRLAAAGATVAYSDPHIPVFPQIRRGRFDLKSVELTPKTLAGYDAVLLATNHDAFDYQLIAAHAKLIVDTRGVYREARGNVVKA